MCLYGGSIGRIICFPVCVNPGWNICAQLSACQCRSASCALVPAENMHMLLSAKSPGPLCVYYITTQSIIISLQSIIRTVSLLWDTQTPPDMCSQDKLCLFYWAIITLEIRIMWLNMSNGGRVCCKSAKCGGACACDPTEPQHYSCFIKNTLFMFHYCPTQLFNTEYLVSWREASLNFSSFKAALESAEDNGPQCCLWTSAKYFLFHNWKQSGRESQGGYSTGCQDIKYYPG